MSFSRISDSHSAEVHQNSWSLEKLTVRISGARNTQRSASFVPPARVVKWSSPAAQWIQIDKTESVGMKVRINKRTLQGVVNYYWATGRAEKRCSDARAGRRRARRRRQSWIGFQRIRWTQSNTMNKRTFTNHFRFPSSQSQLLTAAVISAHAVHCSFIISLLKI